MRRIPIAVLTVVLAFALVAPAIAVTNTVPVTNIVDGDTFDVTLGGKTERIRMLGINTNEIGNCHAAAATARLAELIEDETVKLSADDPNVTLRGRLARWVDVGSTDVGEVMLEEGLGLLFPHPTETDRLVEYRQAEARGRATGDFLWDDDACGSGPQQSADLSLNVRWDAEEDDTVNLNSEWVDVINRSNFAVSLTGWQLRDTALRYYDFANGVSVPADSTIRVHVGSGTDTSTHKYWGLSEPIFSNSVGEGVFLRDPDLDIRADFQYPCVVDCSDSRESVLVMTVNYDAPGDDHDNPNGEWVKIENISSSTVDLYGLQIMSHPFAYHFEYGDTLGGGNTLTLHVGQGSDTSTKKYWGMDDSIFNNSNDSAYLKRTDGVILRSFEWPSTANRCDLTAGGADDLAVSVPGDDRVAVLGGNVDSGLQPLGDPISTTGPTSLACGDFNNDGFMDLAIGMPEKSVSSKSNAGAVSVLYGSALGLPGSADETFHQNSSGVNGAAEAGDRFGSSLTTGDFDNDGRDDLAIGVPGENSWAGAVAVLYGSSGGITTSGDDLFDQNSSGIKGVSESGDQFGTALTAGDFDNDGRDDLAIGVPGEDIGSDTDTGAVAVLYGASGGLTHVGDDLFDQDSPGIKGAGEDGDQFGSALTAGDFDNDGRDDLAIGVPGEDIGSDVDTGAVAVIYGSSGGLTATGDETWHQATPGIKGAGEDGDNFGSALTAGDFDNDGRDDLAIGVPGEDIGSDVDTGAVAVIYGSSGGLTATGDETWHQATSGIKGAGEDGDSFGSALATGDFDNDGRDDLAIGVPGEDIDTSSNAGAVAIIYGSSGGLTASGDQTWHQDSPGIKGTADAGNLFAAALSRN